MTATSLGIALVDIPAGSFRMGNDQPVQAAALGAHPRMTRGDWDERPVRRVIISRPFKISRTPVTVEQFLAFRPGWSAQSNHGFITSVTWYEAVEFCEWLSKPEGKPYRLPTEAEWEYAARAGTAAPFWSGDSLPTFDGDINPWGVANVHTGVSEWCYDWHGEYPDDDEADPVGPSWGHTRVVRGGGFGTMSWHGVTSRAPYYSRSANRSSAPPRFGQSSARKWDPRYPWPQTGMPLDAGRGPGWGGVQQP
ncbi:MAG: formylglycine-generating enzyme family protein [SAR202 cluster bacterium]|nr:formylglycine-generating enzyme family protein [SAR202 cluster bacterium]